MKRSMFSVAVLAAVLAFLYVPIVLVVVYGFIPNGISMSFFDAHGRFIGFTCKWYAQIFSGDYSVKALMQSFWLSLTVAGLSTLVSCVITAFKTYDLIYVLTKGGPGTSTEVISYHIYRQAFTYLKTGNASAMSFILVIILLPLAYLAIRLLWRRRD